MIIEAIVQCSKGEGIAQSPHFPSGRPPLPLTTYLALPKKSAGGGPRAAPDCARRRPAPGFIFHTDRGSQYCSKRFRALVKGGGGLQSMSATGCCYDNAITESFFRTLKRELVQHCSFRTRQEAQGRIFRYIESFYNRKRRHSAIRYLSPEQFEQEQLKVAA